MNPVIEAADDTEGDDAEGADGKGQFGVAIAAEGGQRVIRILDVHRLNNEEVVVQAHYRIDQRDEYNKVRQEIARLV